MADNKRSTESINLYMDRLNRYLVDNGHLRIDYPLARNLLLDGASVAQAYRSIIASRAA